MAEHPVVNRASQVGLVAASATVPATFARSLSKRSWIDQGLITGLSTGTQFVLTVGSQAALSRTASFLAPLLPMPQSWTDEQRVRAVTIAVDLLAVPVGLAVSQLKVRDEYEERTRSFVRQAGWRLGVTGLCGSTLESGLAVTQRLDDAVGADGRLARLPVAVPAGLLINAVAEAVRQRDVPPDHETDPARANPMVGLAAGGGVVLALTAVVAAENWSARQVAALGARALPMSETSWLRLAHTLAMGTMALGTHALWDRAMTRIEAATTTYEDVVEGAETGAWTTPSISGSPESLVSWRQMGREGRRHAISFVRPRHLTDAPAEINGVPLPDYSISTVMQEEPKADPIQVFVGLDNAPTAKERVDLALAEMDRTDAWSRSLLMLVSPTGTGYVNYVALACAQYLTRGDIATVTLQYSHRPSPLSLGMVGRAKEQNRLLWLRIVERLREIPSERRPRVVVFGESLGAHTSQAAFAGWGTLGPAALGIDRALWIGTPALSAWRKELMDPSRLEVDRSLVAIVNDYEQFRALGEEARKKVRYVLLSHDNDGVTKFTPDLLAYRPSWLGPQRPAEEEVPGRSPRGIPPSMRWRPVTTFFQLMVDMKNAQIPGAYRAWAHDYRADLPEFIRDVFDLSCSDEQMERIKDACERREAVREKLFA
ncbi:hypothetical protein N865_05975 [Intrasporangium oryzae NRRL B-24470]|uniref:Alpha/beta-hydrolase catalytic domain-containing protein n=1 Tax=Intrasporangium oryzae NRRL B-24470 TaxID=1386089 RepID=W9GC52_9MICO|nr:alpha/beta-hydrolase family protein [Intrasporangium oryzae]EWT02398.1 hypothetical protein N865_05975 [Intrasporangium oryzae NRRL B-24470]